jgi:Na+-driven multidrug efflux pump
MKKIISNLNKFALPLLSANLLQLLIGQLALSLVGRLAVENVPVINTIEGLLYSIVGILGVFSLAFNMLSSKALGEKNRESFEHLIASALLVSVFVGVIFMAVTLIGANFFLHSIYHFEGKILETARVYLNTMSPYVLLMLISFTLTNLIKVEKKTNYILYVSFAAAFLQVFLSYLFINGLFGIPKLGIFGAALATILSLLFTVCFYCYLSRDLLLKSLKQAPNEIQNILKKSIPLFFQEILEGILFIVIFEAFISRIGVLILASYSILMQGLSYAKMPIAVYSNAVTVYASEAYGERNLKKVRQYTVWSFVIIAILYIFCASLFYFFNQSYTYFLTEDELVAENVKKYVVLAIMMIFPTVIYENFKYALQSLEKEKLVLGLTGSVNVIAIGLMVLLFKLKCLNFTILLSIYGMNYFILGVIFVFIFYRNSHRQWQD